MNLEKWSDLQQGSGVDPSKNDSQQSKTVSLFEMDNTHPSTGVSVLRVPPGTKAITSEDVRRAMEEDD